MKSDTDYLHNLLGQDVLLLPWPKGSKGTKRRWKHLATADMANPKHLAKLNRATNIGVALIEALAEASPRGGKP